MMRKVQTGERIMRISLSALEIILLKGVVYNEKRIGPRTEPCGTPNLSFLASERTEPILMHWVRQAAPQLWPHVWLEIGESDSL